MGDKSMIKLEEAGLVYGQRVAGGAWCAIPIVNGEVSALTRCGDSVPGPWYDFAFRPTQGETLCSRCAAVLA